MPDHDKFKKKVEDYIDSMEAGDPDHPSKKTIILDLPPDTPAPVNIDDKRTKLLSTGAAVKPGQATGKYDRARILNIIKASRHVGIDPNTALSVALQETKLGNLNPENIGNVYAGYGKAPAGLDQGSWEMASFLKEKMEEGKKMGFTDEAHWIQNYNGLGKLKSTTMMGKPQPTKYYGIEVTPDNPLDMRKNPLYGKTIIDLRENVIKQNKDIQSLISSTL